MDHFELVSALAALVFVDGHFFPPLKKGNREIA
jgi:hypothetical protein